MLPDPRLDALDRVFRRRRAAATVVTALLVLVVLQDGFGWPFPPPGIPARDAPLPTVERAYLDAAEHHECAEAIELTTANTTAWCLSPSIRSDHGLSAPVSVSASEAGRAEACSNVELVTSGDDESIPAGDLSWGLCWVRPPAGWRLWDQGTG
jgi:hypothetical protein